MTVPGFFNHYDDPDEFWDEEPIVRNESTVSVRTSSAPLVPSEAQIPRRESSVSHLETVAQEPAARVGSSFASMEVDPAFLPVHVQFRPGWRRYVAPGEVGEELLAAYRGAVVVYLNRIYSSTSSRFPTPQEVSTTAVPGHRTRLAVLLETQTWEEFCEVSSSMINGGQYSAEGVAVAGGNCAVTLLADRRYIRSITVSGEWAATAHPDDIGDKVLECAQRIRSARPEFIAQRDYSRYSDDDLEYHLSRHRLRLLLEKTS